MNYFYGVMPYSTGYIKYFDILTYENGFIIVYPRRSNPTEVRKVKETKKLYHHYTGYAGGLVTQTYAKLSEKHPTDPMKLAVAGMLPHNRLGRKMMDNVKIYAGAEHPHAAQNPQPIEL